MAVNSTEINEIIILNDGTEENQTTFETQVESEKNVAILIMAFLAPIGLGLFRSGLCQRKTFVHSLVKPFVHLAFGTIGFWILGSGFASDSSNGFIGMENFFLNKDSGPREIFQFLSGLYCTAIASNASQEYLSFSSEAILAFYVLAIVYPIPYHWVWNQNSWLKDWEGMEYHDFAGSGGVHLTGGVFGFALALLSKPRPGRFPSLGIGTWSRRSLGTRGGLTSMSDLHQAQQTMKSGQNLALASIASFLTFIGGLSYILYGNSDVLFSVLLSCAGSSCSSILLSRLFTNQWSLYRTRGAFMVGLAVISSAADKVDPWAALIMGFIAGFIYIGGRNVLIKVKIDDPTDAISVHALGGFCGMVLAPVFAQDGLLLAQSHQAVHYICWNLVGAACQTIWPFTLCMLIFGPLACCDKLANREDFHEKFKMRESVKKQGHKCDCCMNKGQIPAYPNLDLKYSAEENKLSKPRLVIDKPKSPTTSFHSPKPAIRETPKYVKSNRATIDFSQTMPLSPFISKPPTTLPTTPKNVDSPFLATISRRSRSYVNVNDPVDDVFDEPLESVKSEVVQIKPVKPKRPVPNIPRAPMIRIDDNNNSGSEFDPQSPQPAAAFGPIAGGITRQGVVNQIHNLRHHDGPQRQSWSERRRVTPLSLTSDHF